MMKNHLSLIALLSILFQLNAVALPQVHENIALENTDKKENNKAAEIQQQVIFAIERFQQTDIENWAFKLDRFENEEGDITSSTERYIVNDLPEKSWVLLEINGKKPTGNQVKEFIKSKLESAGNIALNLGKLINQDSIKYLSEVDGYINASFDVELDKFKVNIKGVLQGTLKLNKHQQFIEEINIVNVAEFSPMFSATISELLITFSFVKIDQAILPNQQKMVMKGRFALFAEIDENSTDTYSNYEYKGGS